MRNAAIGCAAIALFILAGLLCAFWKEYRVAEAQFEYEKTTANLARKTVPERNFVADAFGSSSVASWMQALGAIGAVFSAIWVMHRQHQAQVKRDEKRDEIEVKNMLITAYDEIENFSNAYRDWSDSDFRDESALYAKKIIVFGTDFYSFQDIARNIGKIKDKEIRETTMICLRCIRNFQTNHEKYNEIVDVFNSAKNNYERPTTIDRIKLKDIEEKMKFHASLLVSLYETMCTRVDAFFEVIQREGIIENK